MNYLIKPLVSSLGILGLILLLGARANLIAQDRDEKMRVETNLVLIDILVLDRTGRPVKGLKADQFQLLDNGVRQSIETFSSEEAPVSFGIVYDMHPTTADRTRTVIESLREFKRELGPEDDIFLLAFNMRGQQIFDFVPTVDQLAKHMADPTSREPHSLYDAVFFASDRIQSSRNQKRVLFVISDSADHNSLHPFSAIQRKLASIRTEVYAVIVDADSELGYKDITHKGRDIYPFSRDATALDRAALLDLTLKSGGSTYFGGSKTTLQLYKTFKDIAGEMRSHYTLGFYPDVMDGRRHALRIRLRDVKASKDFVLTYRMSYQANAKNAAQ